MDANVVSSLINAGASIAGGFISNAAQRRSNNTNLQIARETNAQNYRIFKEQMDYNTAMMDKQNAYNSPMQQRQRYEQAGINPYLALGNISSGSQQSALTAPNANAMQSAQVQPETALGESIQNGVNNAMNTYSSLMLAKAQAANIEEDTKGKVVDNSYKASMYAAQLEKLNKESKNIFQDTTLKSLQEYYTRNTMDTSISQAQENLNNTIQQGKYLKIQTDLAQFDFDFKNKNAETQFKAEMAKIASEIFANEQGVYIGWHNADSNRINANANSKNSDTQARAVAQQIIESAERVTGIKLDNIQKSRVMEYVVGLAKANLQHTQTSTDDISNHNWRDKYGQKWVIRHGAKKKKSMDEFGAFWNTYGTVNSFFNFFK